MNALLIVGKVVMILLALGVIVLVLMQPGKGSGVNGLTGAGAESNFFSRHKNHSYEAKLARFTTIGAAVLVVLSVVLVIISKSVSA